jgi:hypothetical protein
LPDLLYSTEDSGAWLFPTAHYAEFVAVCPHAERRVTSRKQAVAIAISEAREAGAKVPKAPAKKASKKR